MTQPKQADKRRPYGRGTGVAHPVDIHVGERIRSRRHLLGLTQQALGKALGLTSQQMYKYESASNRVSASRLFAIAKVLDVPVSYFFADLLGEGTPEDAVDKRSREQPPSGEAT
jgi:transcriptional regulator with XRE-family HTH domain